MDNFQIDITSEGPLLPALKLAFGSHSKFVGYAVRDASEGKRYCMENGSEEEKKYGYLLKWSVNPKPRRLVLFWANSDRDDYVKLPFTMNADLAAGWCEAWLEQQDYGKEPDHDGDNGRGWRIYNEGWGHVDGEWQAFLAVTPSWAMYGK